MILQVNGIQRTVSVAILISDNIDVKTTTKKVTDEEKYFIMIKGTIHQKDIKVNIYSPTLGTSKYIKQLLKDLKRETNSCTIIVEDFITPPTPMGRSPRQSQQGNIKHLL